MKFPLSSGGRKGGRADGPSTLSLINKARRRSGEMPPLLINKRDGAYAFPRQLSSGLSDEAGGSQMLWNRIPWSDGDPGVRLSPARGGRSSQEPVQNVYWC